MEDKLLFTCEAYYYLFFAMIITNYAITHFQKVILLIYIYMKCC